MRRKTKTKHILKRLLRIIANESIDVWWYIFISSFVSMVLMNLRNKFVEILVY